jgi:parallel beta-helix repeat protein
MKKRKLVQSQSGMCAAMLAMIVFTALFLAPWHAAMSDNTDVSGYISSDTTWDLAGSPYIVSGFVIVIQGATLTIQPGVEVKFNPTGSLNIGSASSTAGTLVANGTEGNEILFTANDSASPWSGIDFTSFATNDSSLTHAVIEKGGSSGYLVSVNGSNPTIQNCTLRNSSGDGLRLSGDARPALASNTYENNDGYPINVNSAHSISVVDDTSAFTDNADDRIRYAGGYITENIRIVDPGTPYFVDISVSLRVYNNAVLTIDPGVELQFNPDTSLNIGHITTGTLVANGTEGNEILFTANDSASPWSGIDFTSFVTNDSSLTYAVIENGGSSGFLVSVNGNNPTIKNCTLRNSARDGLKLYKAWPALASNTYENNNGYPINVDYGHSISAVDDTSTFTGNTDNRIRYDGGSITVDTSVANPGIPYFVDATVRVDNNAVLTIDPGVELQFDSDTNLYIGFIDPGKLMAQGTDDANIIFTSGQASPAPGDWRGLYFSDKADDDSIIGHAVVEYGGSTTNSNDGNISVYNSSPTIESCAIRHSITHGINLRGSSAIPNLSCNTITANDVGIHIDGNANPQIHDNDIRGNTTYGVQNENSSVVVVAEKNYWGDADGPGGAGLGSGDAVSQNVDYDPFLTASAPCTLPLNASFAAKPTGGCQDLSVSFTDKSTGDITAWEWDFDGDGTIDSTDRNPVYTYTVPDTYTATLTVSEGVESDTATQDIEVTESLPTADFEGKPLLSGAPPLTVNFTDLSKPCGTDPITAREWDFDNDGTLDSDENPSHTFSDAGHYTVKLTVTDKDGDQDTETKENYIYVSDEAPVANPGGPYTGTEGTPIQFDGSGSYDPNGGSLTYQWDFNNDGVTDSTVENPWHTYSQDSEEQTGGVYTVRLTVYDEANLSGTNTTTAQVADIDPAADFTADPTEGTAPLTVQFTDQTYSYDGIESREWNFGDISGPGTAQNPEHIYANPGTYTVTLTVTEEDGDKSTKEKVEYITVGECTVYYYDGDQDGYGTEDSQCLTGPEGFYTAIDSTDCDDTRKNVHPGAEEVCDGVDNDCDTETDEGCGGCAINDIPGDLDGDCDVDGDDRNILRALFRKCKGDSEYNADADYDGDGCITFGDYRIWYSHYKAANQT